MLVDKDIKAFVYETASASPVPGGGSVSALAGALAAALSAMVARLTIGKKGFEKAAQKMEEIRDSSDALRAELMRDVDRDSESYQNFLHALRMPKETEADQQKRLVALAEAKKAVCRVPMAVAKNALKVIDLADVAVRMGRRDVLTDSAVAVLLAGAAVRGALYNVRFNLGTVKDEAFVRQMLNDAETMEEEVEEKEKAALAAVIL